MNEGVDYCRVLNNELVALDEVVLIINYPNELSLS